MTALRDRSGRWVRLEHDPRNPWVLTDDVLREPVIRCATRLDCREYQRAAGGRIVRTTPERRKVQPC